MIRSSVATKCSRSCRLVIEDLLNFLHELRRQLLKQLQGSKVVLQLLDLGGTEDDRGNVGVLCSPCQAQLGDGATELLSDGCELSDLFIMCEF